MPLDRTRCRPLLQSFDFHTLFVEELGWDKHKASLDIPLEADQARLESIAHMRRFVAWHCPEPASGFPDAAERQTWFLQQVTAGKRPTRRHHERKFDISTATAKRDVEALSNRIQFIGNSNHGFYTLR